MHHPPSEHNQKSGKIKIYYDGGCPMCRVIIKNVDESPERENFDPKDFTKISLPKNISRKNVEKGIHVVDVRGDVYKNAEAILKILDEYPKWRFLATTLRIPGIRQMLPLGYKFISANRRFIFGPSWRVFWVKTTLAFAFAAGFLLSAKLWVSSRSYPLTPVISHLPTIPFPIDYLLFFGLFILLAVIVLTPKPRVTILIFAILIFILGLLDQSRSQPWAYQYLFMLITLGLFSWKSDDTQGQKRILNICRLIMASIYFYSGVQKINLNFLGSIFPWMIDPFIKFLPEYLRMSPYALGVGAPLIEIGIGIGLLTKKYRNMAIVLAILMHLFILLTIGPLGHNWNSVVWPWNVAMIALVLILFWDVKDVSTRDILWPQNFVPQKIFLVLFSIMPLMSFFNLWDSYLSFALYSGNTNSAVIYLSDTAKHNLPASVQQYTSVNPHTNFGGGVNNNFPYGNALDISAWSFGELNVPPYPETRIYKGVAKKICEYTHDSAEIILVVYGRPALINRDRPTRYTCSDL